jgi:hypothetical protein
LTAVLQTAVRDIRDNMKVEEEAKLCRKIRKPSGIGT